MKQTLAIFVFFYAAGAFGAAWDILNREHPFIEEAKPRTIGMSMAAMVGRAIIAGWLVYLIKTA